MREFVKNDFSTVVRSPLVLLSVTLIIFIVMVTKHYPGWNNINSDSQHMQAVTGIYNDWHPPIMARLWSLLRHISDDSGPFYVLHIFFYWFGLGLIALTLNRLGHPYGSWFVLGVGLDPTFLDLTYKIFSDIGMTACFLTAFAILLWHRTRNEKVRPAIMFFVAILLFYGVFVRVNAIFAASPLIIYATCPRIFSKPTRLAISCVALIASIIAMTPTVNHKIFNALAYHPIYQLEIFDIAGIASHSGDLSVFNPDLSITSEQLANCYTPIYWDTLNKFGKCPFLLKRVEELGNAGNTDVLGRLWLSAIAKHPLAYLEHRLLHFNSEIAFIAPRHHIYWRVLLRMNRGVPFDTDQFSGLEWRLWDYVMENPFVAPLFPLVLSFIMFILSWPRKSAEMPPLMTAAFCLATSGLLYSLAYFFIGVASDLRYHFWMMLTAPIACCFYLSSRPSVSLTRAEKIGAVALGLTAISIFIAQTLMGDSLFMTQ